MILSRERLIKGKYPDFVLCLGTTRKDEEMFGRIAKMLKENSDFEVIFELLKRLLMVIESAVLYLYSWEEAIECKVLC